MSTDNLPVAQIMNRQVATVSAELPIDQLILLLVNERLGAALVVGPRGNPVGSVSLSDLVTEEYEWAQMRRDTRPWLRIAGARLATDEDLFAERLRSSRTVADIMSPLDHAVRPDTPVGRAAAMMVAHHLERLIVMERDGAVVGLLTQFDLTRLLAEQGRDGPGVRP